MGRNFDPKTVDMQQYKMHRRNTNVKNAPPHSLNSKVDPVNEVIENYLILHDLDGGSEEDTRSIALGDVNGDVILDVVVGNPFNQPNQLLINSGDGTFSNTTAVSLTGGSLDTTSIVLGDVNGDGVLDFVVGNYVEENQVLHYSVCQSGGARLYAKSWCFKCSSFM